MLIRADALTCCAAQLKQTADSVRARLQLLSITAGEGSRGGGGGGSGKEVNGGAAAAAAAAAVAADPETAQAARTLLSWTNTTFGLASLMCTDASAEYGHSLLQAFADSGVADHAARGVLLRGLLSETLRELVGDEAAVQLSDVEDLCRSPFHSQQHLMRWFTYVYEDFLGRFPGVDDRNTEPPVWTPIFGPCCQYLVIVQGLCSLACMDGLGAPGVPDRVARALSLRQPHEAGDASDGDGSGGGSGRSESGSRGEGSSGGGTRSGSGIGGGGGVADSGGDDSAVAGADRPFEALLSVLSWHTGAELDDCHLEFGPMRVDRFGLSPRAVCNIACRLVRLAVRSGRVWVSREEGGGAAAGGAGTSGGGEGQQGAPGRAVLRKEDVARVALQGLAVFRKGVEAGERWAGEGVCSVSLGEGEGGGSGTSGAASEPQQAQGHGQGQGQDQVERLRRKRAALAAEAYELGCKVLSHCMRGAAQPQQDALVDGLSLGARTWPAGGRQGVYFAGTT